MTAKEKQGYQSLCKQVGLRFISIGMKEVNPGEFRPVELKKDEWYASMVAVFDKSKKEWSAPVGVSRSSGLAYISLDYTTMLENNNRLIIVEPSNFIGNTTYSIL